MGAVSEFILRMNDQVSDNASLAGASLKSLEAKIRSENEALGSLNDKAILAGRALQQMQVGNTDGKLDSKIEKAKTSLESLNAAISEKKGGIASLEGVKPSLEAAQQSADSMGGKLNSMTDAMQNANGATGKLTAALKSLGPEGAAVAAVLTVVIGVVTALVAEFLDLAASCISVSQEKDALAETFAALSTGAESGRELVDALSDVAASLPQSEGKVLAWGKSLMAAGLEGDKLNKAVRAVASSAAIMGNDGGAAETLIKRFAMMAEAGGKVKLDRRIMSQLAEAGVSAKTLADALGVDASKLSTMSLDATKLGDALQDALVKKGGKALEKMSLTWDSISGKLKDGIDDLFEDMGPAVAPFMAAVKDLFAEFSAGSTTMSGVKSVLMSFFTSVFEIGTKVVNALHMGFLYVEIGALKAGIALAPIGRQLKAIATNQTFIDGLVIVLKGLGVVALIVVAAMAIMGATIGTIIAAFGFVAGVALAAVGAIVGGVTWLIGSLDNAGPSIKVAIMHWADDAENGARNFVNGIARSILAGIDVVVAAVKSLGQAAAGAFTGFFKIHSPSRLMYEYGLQLPAGVAGGVEAGTADVEDSVDGMSKAGANAAGPMAGSGGGNGSKVYNFAPGSIVIGGGDESMVARVRAAIIEVLEQTSRESGPVPT